LFRTHLDRLPRRPPIYFAGFRLLLARASRSVFFRRLARLLTLSLPLLFPIRPSQFPVYRGGATRLPADGGKEGVPPGASRFKKFESTATAKPVRDLIAAGKVTSLVWQCAGLAPKKREETMKGPCRFSFQDSAEPATEAMVETSRIWSQALVPLEIQPQAEAIFVPNRQGPMVQQSSLFAR
jgi:hypothetical protein